jgi:hypothetical protein
MSVSKNQEKSTQTSFNYPIPGIGELATTRGWEPATKPPTLGRCRSLEAYHYAYSGKIICIGYKSYNYYKINQKNFKNQQKQPTTLLKLLAITMGFFGSNYLCPCECIVSIICIGYLMQIKESHN